MFSWNTYRLFFSDNPQCRRRVHYPTSCFPFIMPDDIVPSDVSKAELWIHKNRDAFAGNHTIVISEGVQEPEGQHPRKTMSIIEETVLTGKYFVILFFSFRC